VTTALSWAYLRPAAPLMRGLATAPNAVTDAFTQRRICPSAIGYQYRTPFARAVPDAVAPGHKEWPKMPTRAISSRVIHVLDGPRANPNRATMAVREAIALFVMGAVSIQD
jgi:hypothetical protein